MTIVTGIPDPDDPSSGCSDHQVAYKGLSSRVGLVRPTHYGSIFEVEDRGDDPNNPAYTNVELGLHTDLPYYEYIPGAQFLHCVRQHRMEGGENQVKEEKGEKYNWRISYHRIIIIIQFADGHRIAEILRREHPEDFRLLCETPLEWQDEGVEADGMRFWKVNRYPTFQHDFQGR